MHQIVAKTDKHDVAEDIGYQRTRMQREMVIDRLRQRGCRITRQRLMLLDIILDEECSSCKEIYYKASKVDDRIGSATVYRMINALEDIGAINRKNMYKIACAENCSVDNACTIELDDGMIIDLSAKEWNRIIKAGLFAAGYIDNQNIIGVSVKPCGCA
ncbi:MAG: transcriptional repressor [Coprococcus sp.]